MIFFYVDIIVSIENIYYVIIYKHSIAFVKL